MKTIFTDKKFLLAIIIANFFIYFTFTETKVFWYIITGAMLFLISYSLINEDLDDQLSVGKYLFYGITSGLFLYGIFWLGYQLIEILSIHYLNNQLVTLYKKFSPVLIWHFIVLVLIIIPGEEIFFRGFIQKQILKHTNFWTSVLLSAFLYAFCYIYSGYILIVIAALVSGIVWGFLYAWKRSLPLVIISHLTFDLLIFVFLPFT